MMARRWSPTLWFVIAATLVFALGAWLRMDQLGSQTLIDDEWHAVHQLVRSSPGQFMLSLGHADYSIPLTLYFWFVAQTVGLTELAMRLPSLLAGLATLLVLPWALRGRLDGRVLLVFGLCLAVSPLLAGYARMARPYALTLLLSFVALAWLDLATRGDRLRVWPACGYCIAAGVSVWLHAITAPFFMAPLLWLALQRARGHGHSWRALVLLAAMTGLLMALAVLPPLWSDFAALGSKAGKDAVRWSTLRGVWHVWLGTASPAVVVLMLVLAAFGAGPVWRASMTARWALAGLGLTLIAVLVLRPVWIFNPLTFGRYLLPALPLLLLAVAAGLVRLTDGGLRWLAALAPRFKHSAAVPTRWAPMALALALTGAWWFTSPWPALLRVPNTNTLSYYYQFDFRPRKNPVVSVFDAAPVPDFWRSLAARPVGSVTVAVAPFRFESYDWLAPVWERVSGQRVMPGFLSGGCGRWFFGEVPLDGRFRFVHAVHLADTAGLAAKRVDFVAFQKASTVLDDQGTKRRAPECEDWLRQRFGTPEFEDTQMVVWRLRGPTGEPAGVPALRAPSTPLN